MANKLSEDTKLSLERLKKIKALSDVTLQINQNITDNKQLPKSLIDEYNNLVKQIK